MTPEDIERLSEPPELDRPPRRVVSLVPSMTESLFDLGFGGSVVGITDYCVHPAAALEGLPRLGGPKNPRLDDLLALEPELVFANQEENTPEAVQKLADAGVKVWLTFPRSVDGALEVLLRLLGVYHTDAPALHVKTLQMSVDWARAAAVDQPPVRYFCPIWQDETQAGELWWMAFNQETYSHDLLSLFGGENVFAGRQRRYPLAADLGHGEARPPGDWDTRYPRVTVEEVQEAAPDLILLPDEPYAFEQGHKQAVYDLLADTPAVKNGRVSLVDGSLLTWHGTRLGKALQELPALFA